ncbi:MFS transporter [Candidatus Woesearchaeota archaeon]|nr:MFS transporter [Candidatus Woesearchaeota archaeon]
MFGPIYAIFVEQIGGNILTAGWAWALYAISIGITVLIMGKVEDRIKKDELFVVLGFGLASFGFLGYLFISEPWHLFIVQTYLGVAWALGTPAFDSLYSKNLDHKKTDTEWADYEASVKITEGIAAFIGAGIAAAFGFKLLFMIMFAIAFIAWLIILNILRKRSKISKTL